MIFQLKIWDSAGSERFKSLTTSYYRNADAAILVYCINESKTLHELHSWASEVSNRESDMLKILVGNKNDLDKERVISHQTAVEFAMMENLDLAVECSAKCDDNVDYIFYTVARKLIIKEIEKHSNNNNSNSAQRRTGARTADSVVEYQGTSKSMGNLFISPRASRKRNDKHSFNTVELTTTTDKEKSMFQRICTIL